jgi:hypothetical protein
VVTSMWHLFTFTHCFGSEFNVKKKHSYGDVHFINKLSFTLYIVSGVKTILHAVLVITPRLYIVAFSRKPSKSSHLNWTSPIIMFNWCKLNYKGSFVLMLHIPNEKACISFEAFVVSAKWQHTHLEKKEKNNYKRDNYFHSGLKCH